MTILPDFDSAVIDSAQAAIRSLGAVLDRADQLPRSAADACSDALLHLGHLLRDETGERPHRFDPEPGLWMAHEPPDLESPALFPGDVLPGVSWLWRPETERFEVVDAVVADLYGSSVTVLWTDGATTGYDRAEPVPVAVDGDDARVWNALTAAGQVHPAVMVEHLSMWQGHAVDGISGESRRRVAARSTQ